ncbi:PEP-CTERM sorting domain-containing protein [Sphingomonas sp. CJ99]
MPVVASVRALLFFGLLSGASMALAYDTPPQSPPAQSSGKTPVADAPSSGPVSIPEPEQFALFALGVAGLAVGRVMAKRRRG